MAQRKTKPTPAELETILAGKTTEERIEYYYQHGIGSIQDIARWNRYSVEEVLHIIGQDEMTTVALGGDQIDEEDVQKAGLQLNRGTTDRVRFSTD